MDGRDIWKCDAGAPTGVTYGIEYEYARAARAAGYIRSAWLDADSVDQVEAIAIYRASAQLEAVVARKQEREAAKEAKRSERRHR